MKSWPARFERARERLAPVLEAGGFRLVSLERDENASDSAFAEYFRRALRLRLVWEGRERVLWVEAARQEGAQVVSRWHDVEWALAGERLPVNRDTSDARIDALVEAVRRFLAAPPTPSP
ncbi:MAG TPA: hypothetical protein VGA42_09555 [Gemmatimonadales bacterium]|jgi:hypothetical protein